MMYLEFLGLQSKPFHTTPDPYFLYLSASHKEALGSIIYGVKEKKGFMAVTGEVGLGKTTVLRLFLTQIDPANQHIIYLFNPNRSFMSVVKTVLRELGHDPIEGGETEVVEQLHLVLIDEYYNNKTVVLLIDDAQNMPVTTLEQLRILCNLETPQDKLLQIVLLGQPELDSILSRYELRQIRQRIAVRAVIDPLSQKESILYIQHRLNKAGGQGKKFFTRSALSLIVREAQGIPRRLNILCDNAFVTAVGYEKSVVTASMAKEVIRDLGGQPSRSFWKLIPLAAGVLILVLALVALMPLTHSQFSDTPLVSEIEQLFDRGKNRNQDLVSTEKDVNPNHQASITMMERAKSWLMVSVSAVWEEVQEPAIASPKPKVPELNVEAAVVLEHQSTGVLATKSPPLGNIKDVLSHASEEPVDLTVQETTGALNQTYQKQVRSFAEHDDRMGADQTQLPFPEEGLLAQGESEPSADQAIEANRVHPDPGNLKDPLIQTTEDVAEGAEPLPKKNSLPLVTPTKKLVPLQELPRITPDAVGASLPISKTMKDGDTLAGFMQEVYGSASPSTLRFVLAHNQHIVNVRKIYPGQEILFPPLRNEEVATKAIDDAQVLMSHQGEKLSAAKTILTQSSMQPKAKQKKEEAKHRDPPYAVARVQEGDTLEKLVQVVYGSADPLSIQRVLDYNPQILNPKKILPGQDIAFPRMIEEKNALVNQSFQANFPE